MFKLLLLCFVGIVLAEHQSYWDLPPEQWIKPETKQVGILGLPSGSSLLVKDIDTSFSCTGKAYGYYADVKNECKIYHVCNPFRDADNNQIYTHYSFVCAPGSYFDQTKLTCLDDSVKDRLPCQEAELHYPTTEQRFAEQPSTPSKEVLEQVPQPVEKHHPVRPHVTHKPHHFKPTVPTTTTTTTTVAPLVKELPSQQQLVPMRPTQTGFLTPGQPGFLPSTIQLPPCCQRERGCLVYTVHCLPSQEQTVSQPLTPALAPEQPQYQRPLPEQTEVPQPQPEVTRFTTVVKYVRPAAYPYSEEDLKTDTPPTQAPSYYRPVQTYTQRPAFQDTERPVAPVTTTTLAPQRYETPRPVVYEAPRPVVPAYEPIPVVVSQSPPLRVVEQVHPIVQTERPMITEAPTPRPFRRPVFVGGY